MTDQSKSEATRQLILESLKICLDKHAYSYISMQLVADEAGISKGGLRYHFPTKESLFIALLADFFNKIEEEHMSIVNSPGENNDKVVLSTLFGIEQFVLNETNIKIFLNLILYGLQDKKMRGPIQEFFRNHLNYYKEIITQAKSNLPPIDKSEFNLDFLARITQVIFLSTGLLETIDPIGMNPPKLVRYVISLFE